MLKYPLIFLKSILAHRSGGANLGQFRYYRQWREALRPGSSSVKDEQPWLTFDVIRFFDKKLPRTARVFEYGGGGSTLFWVNRASEVVTVEHHKEWFAILSDMIKKKGSRNWTGKFIEPGEGLYTVNPDKADPAHYYTDDAAYLQNNFQAYASAIDAYPSGHFDLVLVDGRSRPSCMQHGMAKLKKGGYLVLDNSDRGYYLEHFKETLEKEYDVVMDDYGPCPYLLEFSKTTVWKKK